MNNLEEIKSRFPLKCIITQEIIDTANVNRIYECIGALTLMEALGITEEITWSVYTGSVWKDAKGTPNNRRLRITTEEDLDMMEVTKPQFVTFILADDDID